MHVVAYLPRALLAHLRAVLGEAHTLSATDSVTELHTRLRVGDADLLVVDPVARMGQEADAVDEVIAAHPSLPVIVYTTLTPTAMRQVMLLARRGVQHVVLNRFDDEPARFLELIERVPAHPMAELLLRELAAPLRVLPLPLARAIERLVRSPAGVRNSQELAVQAGVTTRTLYRQLGMVGLQPRHLIVCARLLRAYTLLRGRESRLKEVAHKLGYGSPDLLRDQFREWTGQSPKELRGAVTPTEFVQLLTGHLRGATTTQKDAVESV